MEAQKGDSDHDDRYPKLTVSVVKAVQQFYAKWMADHTTLAAQQAQIDALTKSAAAMKELTAANDRLKAANDNEALEIALLRSDVEKLKAQVGSAR